MKTNHPVIQSKPGQAMSETAIMIALVAVVSIGGLTYLSGAIQDGLANHANSLTSNELADLTTPKNEVSENSSVSNKTANIADSTPGFAAGADPDADVSGLNLPTVTTAAESSQQVDTTGAKGDTQVLLASLDTAIQNAVNSGKISTEQANALWGLSQQGHKLGNTIDGVNSTYNGSMNTKERIGAVSLSDIRTMQNSGSVINTDLDSFKQILGQLQTNGALSDPALNSQVTSLANQIIDVSSKEANKGTSEHAISIFSGNAGTTVHNNSTQICQAGKAGDNCMP